MPKAAGFPEHRPCRTYRRSFFRIPEINRLRSDARVLAVLEEQGPQRLTDLANLTSIDVSTLSRLIAGMEKREFLSRQPAPESRREIVISISNNGSQVLSEVVPIALDYEKRLLGGVSPDDLAATKRTLRIAFTRLLERAGRAMPPSKKTELK